MATHCIFLNCNNSYNIWPYVKSVKIGCLFQKKNRTENVKMLLQNSYVNNGVTNGLKHAKQLYMVKQEKSLASSLCE